ncbi:MAG TPA: sigma-70 family RNA polymerase sigma factor [Vicinamibacterales bacterium]|nr:sigma-70 family RNA polymerase sigma factor [Vicinamibacterales bacterium]
MAEDPKDHTTTLLSDQPTVELIIRARGGDSAAIDAILQRCLPSLKRWAHGRLPAAARGHLDTGDLVQDAAMNAIARLDTFEPRHVGAMPAYLRQSVINRIRDEMRRFVRRPVNVELPVDLSSDAPSPEEQAIHEQTYARYRAAMNGLKPRERELVIARVEAQWTTPKIAEYFGFNTADGARMAVNRAMQRLAAEMKSQAR